MDNSITETVEKLFEKVENYSKTTIQLGKHLAIYSSAEIISNVAVKIVVFSLLGKAYCLQILVWQFISEKFWRNHF